MEFLQKLSEERFITIPPRKIRQTVKILSEDSNNYTLSVGGSLTEETPGGPVLNEQGEVVGVVSSTSHNTLTVTKARHLGDLIIETIVSKCSSFKPSEVTSCIKEETEKFSLGEITKIRLYERMHQEKL